MIVEKAEVNKCSCNEPGDDRFRLFLTHECVTSFRVLEGNDWGAADQDTEVGLHNVS